MGSLCQQFAIVFIWRMVKELFGHGWLAMRKEVSHLSGFQFVVAIVVVSRRILKEIKIKYKS